MQIAKCISAGIAVCNISRYLRSMPSWPTAIFFDFDGVIVNSEPIHHAALRETLSREDIHIDEAEYYKDLIGYDDRGAIQHMFKKRNRQLSATALLRIADVKCAVTRDLLEKRDFTALAGVHETVRGLHQHYPLAICSGALRDEIEMMLEGIGLRDCFAFIVAAEDVSRGKPDPEGYLKTLELMELQIKQNLQPNECLVIEDAPTVIRSVKAKGFRTLGVATSHPISELTDADHAVTQLTSEAVLRQIPHLKFGI